MIRVTDQPFRISDAVAEFEAQAAGAGAIVTFSGLVRPRAKGEEVSTLHLQAYSPMTENGIRDAVNRAKEQWPLTAVQVTHRIGNMSPGEAIVFVAAASAHRRAAFEAADFLMDYLKTEAVFWKKEVTPSGAHWIEPRAEDYRDRERWTEEKGS
ncbi:molybdenum cofactor biosynthesis protein MoaE [Hyphomonas jannaschiana]|uniref:molybdenum cofactor biosynthesis protein MoaE n=1 Tax=Hyphomonas jannaschiana TaxID=86 RepID=UPI0035C751D7